MLQSVSFAVFMAEAYGFRFVPACGPDWQGDWDLGKQPLCSIHEASADAAQLDAWAAKYRNCNWLYVPADAEAVLDVDPRHGGDVLLAQLEAEHGPLPRTATVRTGGGGTHFYFTVPSGLSFSHDIAGNAGLTFACGGKHGFVVPPCVHKDGPAYAWIAAPWDVPIAPAPEWLLRLAQPEPARPEAQASRGFAPRSEAPASPMQFVWAGDGERLATHPGESEGGRHRTLCVLLGRELGLGRCPVELEPELLAWAERCVPPMAHADALRQLKSLSRKAEAKAEQQTQQFSEVNAGSAFTSVKASPAFTEVKPSPGEGWLTHGLIGEFAEAIATQIEGSLEPVVFCLLSSFGSAIGPSPFIRVGAERHHANAFAVLVAPSGVGKSEPWAICSALMEYADAEWHRTAITSLGSGEGLIERLETSPIAFAIEAEFGGVLAKARREGSTLTPTLCNAWDGRRLEIANRGEAKLRAEGHHVSLWANVTDAELAKRLNTSLESVNGFGNRFLWLKQQRVRHLPFGGDLRCLERFAQPLRDAIAKAKAIGEVTWSEAAKPIWSEAYASLCKAQESHWSLGRARSQALRLCLIFALLDGSAELRPEHVRAGLSAWAWAEASAKAIFGVQPEPSRAEPAMAEAQADAMSFVWTGDAPAEQQTQRPDEGSPEAKALARIEALPGILRGDLLRKVKAKASALDAALAMLKAKGLAYAKPSPGGKGEGWHPVKAEPSPFTGGEAFTLHQPSPVVKPSPAFTSEVNGEGSAMTETEFLAGLMPEPERIGEGVCFVVQPSHSEPDWLTLCKGMSNTEPSEAYPTPSFRRLDRQQLELLQSMAKAELSRSPAKPSYARHVEFVKAQAELEQVRRQRIGHYDTPMPEAEFVAGLMAL